MLADQNPARLAVVAFLLAACDGLPSKTAPGFCDSTADCPTGQVCETGNQDPNRWHRCVCMGSCADGGGLDGGEDAVAGPDGQGGDSGDTAIDTQPVDAAGSCGRNEDCPTDKPVCSAGRCVQCAGEGDCRTDPARSFCISSMCVGCAGAGAQACSARAAAKPVCGGAGACVECATSTDCTADPAAPICDPGPGKCVRCSTDEQCVQRGAGPGICMSHQDGRCATEGETLYVENKSSTCGGAGTTCTKTTPCCSPQTAIDALTSTRRVIAVRGTVDRFALTHSGPQVSVVGQAAASVAGGASSAVVVSGGDLYLRAITATLSAAPAIVGNSGATVRLDTVTVTANLGGGILLDAAKFEIRNTKVTGNGPGQMGAVTWGGLLVQNTPVGGPASLDRVTVKDNKAPGLTCSGPIQGTGVFALGNSTIDIAATCMVTPCSPAGPICGSDL